MSKWILPSEETFKGVMALALLDESNTPDEAKIIALRNARKQAESDLTDALDMLEEVANTMHVDIRKRSIETFLNKFRSHK